MFSELVVFAVFGVVIGAVGRLLVVGDSPSGVGSWIAHGVLGAFLGGALGLVGGARAPDAATGACLASYVGAIGAVALHHARVWAGENPFVSRRSTPR
jgi:uncharacterized membrane protein YeaQ/YmgE (transglycosylase-associated protein family)